MEPIQCFRISKKQTTDIRLITDLLNDKGFVTIDGDFKYLIKMPMDSVTEENVANIVKEKENTEKELQILEKTTTEKMWLSELTTLEKEYAKYKVKREKIQAGTATKNNTSSSCKKKPIVKKKK